MKRFGDRQIMRGSAESARYQIEFGRQLALEKQSCFEAGRIWRKYVADMHDLSRERADELIRIGTGKVEVGEVRARKRTSQRSSRMDSTANISAKARFLYDVRYSLRICDHATLRVNNKEFSESDKAEMNAAVTDLIFAWQHLFDIFR